MAIWRQAEVSWIERNNARQHVHQEALVAWNKERDRAKAEGQWVGWKKPVLGKVEGLLPQLVLSNDGDDGDAEESGNESAD
ncbi:hypothetical protein J3R83DRAFT_11631 [Lanmaoa asiatica]|nr:hypothetical protein J3R83DRAFT_11631 [Lanmaoa asiatica]